MAWLLAGVFGADGTPVGYLASVVVACAMAAIVLDKYERPISRAIFGRDESSETSPGPEAA